MSHRPFSIRFTTSEHEKLQVLADMAGDAKGTCLRRLVNQEYERQTQETMARVRLLVRQEIERISQESVKQLA